MTEELWLHFARFLLGSTLLFSTVWILERAKIIVNLQLRSLLWRLAIIAALVLMLPISTSLFSPYYLSSPNTSTPYLPTPSANTQFVSAQQTNSPPAAVPQDVTVNTGATTQTITNADTNTSSRGLAKEPGFSSPSIQSPTNSSGSSNNYFEFDWEFLTKYTTLILLAWTLLSSLALLRLFSSYRRGIRSLGERQPIPTNSQLYCAYSELCNKFELTQIPSLTQSSHTATPVTLLHNEICLPNWADQSLSPGELNSLLAHELGHIKNRDLQFLLLSQLLCCLFFFQPLLFLARNRLVDLSEFLADQCAVQQCHDSNQVANTLLNCATKVRGQQNLQLSLAMTGKPSRLRLRVEEILRAGGGTISNLSITRKLSVSLSVLAIILMVPTFKYSYAANQIGDGSNESANQSNILIENRQAISINVHKSNGHSRANWTESGKSEDINWYGTIGVDDAETTITALDPSGYFDYSSRGYKPDRNIRFEYNAGNINIDYKVDGRNAEFTEIDRAWFHQVLLRFFRRTGVGAEERVSRLLRQGGVDTVVTELPFITSDSAHRIYTTTLVKTEPLNDMQFDRVIKAAGTVSSDSEMRHLMLAMITYSEVSGQRWDSLLQATLSISSDSEMRHLLEEIVTSKPQLTEAQWDYFLAAADTISSDSEARRLLEILSQHTDALSNNATAFLKVADSISSDSESRRLMQSIAENSDAAAKNPELFFKIAKDISSDSEMRRLLSQKHLIEQMDGDNWRHYFAAASTISSDGEMRSLLVTVMQSNRLNQLGWTLALRLIDEEISSSGEKGSALRQAAKSLPDNEALKNRYNNAVKNVSSRSTRESLALQ